MKEVKLLQKMTESAVMIALATILSLLKVVELPYGGSITFVSMLPIIIIAYRYGFGWGVLSGAVYGLIQMLFGLNNLSYATSFWAAIAIIFLDYLFAFSTSALAGLFRNVRSAQAGLGYGALLACFARYVFHVISGCTVWAGFATDVDGFVYSLSYNATYMLPETIITVIGAVYVASVVDFSKPRITAAKKTEGSRLGYILSIIAGLVALAGVTVISAMVFPNLQNADTGDFMLGAISSIDFTPIIITAVVALVLIVGLLITKNITKKKV